MKEIRDPKTNLPVEPSANRPMKVNAILRAIPSIFEKMSKKSQRDAAKLKNADDLKIMRKK